MRKNDIEMRMNNKSWSLLKISALIRLAVCKGLWTKITIKKKRFEHYQEDRGRLLGGELRALVKIKKSNDVKVDVDEGGRLG